MEHQTVKKRVMPVLLLFSAVFGAARTVADLIYLDNNTVSAMGKGFLSGLVMYAVLVFLSHVMNSGRITAGHSFSGNAKHLYCLFLVLLLLSYGVCFAVYFPGVGINDGLNILNGGMKTSRQFPPIYCRYVVLLTEIGRRLGSLQYAVAIHSAVQIVLVSCISAGILVWLFKLACPLWCKIAGLLYYVFSPFLSMYAISMLRDTVFSLLLCVLSVMTYEELFGGKKRGLLFYIGFGAAGFGVVALRSNGIYIMLVFLAVILLMNIRNARKVIIPAVFAVLAVLIGRELRTAADTEPLFQEMAGIPIQQIAAVVSEDGEMSAEQREFTESIMPLELLREKYDPYSSDPVKWNSNFDRVFLNEHKGEFLGTWLEMLPDNFVIYVKAYLRATYWYWAPKNDGKVQCFFTIETTLGNQTLEKFIAENGIHDAPLISGLLYNFLDGWYKTAYYFLREGISMWILLAMSILIVTEKAGPRFIGVCLPWLLNYGTLLLSTPISRGYRYVLVYAYSFPFFLAFMFVNNRSGIRE